MATIVPSSDPLSAMIDEQGVVILDGGLATELEARGHDLGDALWSARLLLDDPEAIAGVHRSYLDAGADLVVTSSYQATLQGFQDRGVSASEARERLGDSVRLALDARDRFDEADRVGRRRPLVAASVGPYGAARADGSEYTGDYDLDQDGLYGFHAERFALLADTGADLLACETIPSGPEARALLHLLDETEKARAWFTFTARDGRHLSDGTPLAEMVRELDHERVVAIGVNCVAPSRVLDLLGELRDARRPRVAYPNSGETWDAGRRAWDGAAPEEDSVALAAAWRDAGARVIGGCCRVGPEAIRRLRKGLLGPGQETTS